MTLYAWRNLKVGDYVLNNNYTILQITEIAEDDKSLSHWWKRDHPDAIRLIKFEISSINYHTWDVDHTRWHLI